MSRLFVFIATAALAAAARVGGGEQDRIRYEPVPAFVAGEPFRIYPGGVTQSEPVIAIDPVDGDLFFVSANTINTATSFISEGIYVSTDRGITWSGSDTCSGAPVQFHRGDPSAAVDAASRLILSRLGFTPGLFSHNSTDRGASWSGQVQIASGDQDRASLATDAEPSSPYYGRTYAGWIRFSPPYPAMASWSDSGGRSWSAPVQINAPSQRGQGVEVAAGDSNVYACWAAVGSASPFTEEFVGFASSGDGGMSWSASEQAIDINGISGTLPSKSNIRVNGLPKIAVDRSGGPFHGRIYVAAAERNNPPAGSDPDITLYSSDDGGVSWSAGVRVNRDGINNGKIQYFPAVCVDATGGVNVLFYSDANTTADSSGIHLARSVDGGAGWIELEIGGHRFKPQPIGGLGQGYQGDNIAISSSGDSLWPVWTDNSTGIYQLWTCAVRISLLDPVDAFEPVDPEVPRERVLLSSYPNPFNASTTMVYSLGAASEVSIAVHDIAGRSVGVLTEGRKGAGKHSAAFDAGDLPSGVYIVRLRAEKATAAIKILLLR